MLKQLVGALLLTAIGAGAMYALGPEQRVEVPAPPAKAETVGVTPDELAEIQRAWFEGVPDEATSDERNQVDTLYRTEKQIVQRVDTVVKGGGTDTVVRYVALPGRWYVDSLTAPQSPGDSAVYAMTWLEGRPTGEVLRQDAAMRHPSPPGPLKSVAADSAGVHVDYMDSWPDRSGPSFWARKIPASVACGAEAAYVGSVEAYLACETGSFAQIASTELMGWLF